MKNTGAAVATIATMFKILIWLLFMFCIRKNTITIPADATMGGSAATSEK
jgi:hypothetical protein